MTQWVVAQFEALNTGILFSAGILSKNSNDPGDSPVSIARRFLDIFV